MPQRATIALILFTLVGLTDGFLLLSTGRNHFSCPREIDFLLEAKAARKKKKKKTHASNGGFGRVAVKEENETHDYSVFPALEQSVSETLIPSPKELQTAAGELPDEIYDRLDQIYGFPVFNYEVSEADDSMHPTKTSFEDLISSAGPSENSPRTAGTKMTDSGLRDLLATATGKDVASTIPRPEDSTIDAIFNLPPFKEMRVLHVDPLVIAVDDFFTEAECDRYVAMSTAPTSGETDSPFQTKSMTVGKDAMAKAQRTSTTWFHHYKSVPELMAKASRLLGLDSIDQWEEPQTVRYRRQEKFTWHLDALSPSEALPERGGQRIATLLVYLTELGASDGGATIFRDLSSAGTMLKV
eukprot:scaffold4026_cov117-Cylindrotheca_fusiformis.AAC.17